MADKKLLEESVIARFQTLANIKGSEKGVLSESAPAGGARFGKKDGHGQRNVPPFQKREELDEEVEEEGWMKEGEEEAAPEMGDMAGDDMGATSEGGDAKGDLQAVLSAMSEFIQKHVPELSDQEIEMDSGAEAADQGEEDEEEAAPAPGHRGGLRRL